MLSLAEIIPAIVAGGGIALWTAFTAVMYARRDSRQKISLLEAQLRAAKKAATEREWAADDHNRAHHREDGNRLVLPAADWLDMPTETTTQWGEIFKR